VKEISDEQRLPRFRSLTEAGFRSLAIGDAISVKGSAELRAAIARPGREATLMVTESDPNSTR